MRYLDDFTKGQRFDLGSFSLTAEDIIAFAARYDPQPFHLEDDSTGPFGGLIASGWQTGSECQALLVKSFLNDAASLGSPGVERLLFLKPVRADTVYSGTFTIEDVVPSQKRPDRGRVLGLLVLEDPDGTPVYSLAGMMMFAKR